MKTKEPNPVSSTLLYQFCAGSRNRRTDNPNNHDLCVSTSELSLGNEATRTVSKKLDTKNHEYLNNWNKQKQSKYLSSEEWLSRLSQIIIKK